MRQGTPGRRLRRLRPCVLYPNFRRDFLVRLAIHGRRHGLLRARWTGRIPREWIRAVLRQRPELREALRRTRQLMDQHVRGCRVRGYERWDERLTLPDADDRHVLAAALAWVADVIVTFNTTDFPAAVLGAFGISAVEPDTFAFQLLESGIVAQAAAEHRASLQQPPLSVAEYLDALVHHKIRLVKNSLVAASRLQLLTKSSRSSHYHLDQVGVPFADQIPRDRGVGVVENDLPDVIAAL